MIAYLFPGQGSQFVGMGKELFEEYKEFVEQADEVLGYSIKKLCLEDPDKQLGLTQFTQPALYVVNALSYLKQLEDGVKPDYLLGHSLGEYDALFAGGVFDFQDGLRLVKKRGELMGNANGGKMLAIKNQSPEDIKNLLFSNGLEGVDIANLNMPSQTIISGVADQIEIAGQCFKEAGVVSVPLKVSGAFHSRYMKSAAMEFESYIKDFDFHEMKIPVVSNYTGRIHKQEEIKDNMVKQIYNSVQWVDSIRYVWGKGVEEFKQVGPGRVVITLANNIKKESTPLIVEEEVPEYNGKLGNKGFLERYQLALPCVCGPMHKGISEYDFIKRLADQDMLGFVGSRGLEIKELENIIEKLANNHVSTFGVSVDYILSDPDKEKVLIDTLIAKNVSLIQASGYFNVTENLAYYKLCGLKKSTDGKVVSQNRVFLKTTRPEIAETFMNPIPGDLAEKLYQAGKITKEQADMAKNVSMADEIVMVSSGADRTGIIPISTLLPQVIQTREMLYKKFDYNEEIYIGVAGAIGDPISAVEAFLLGADFIMTGSIHQCTKEAKVSAWVKEKLEKVEIQDTEIIPCGNVYEIGMKMQVLKKGVFFAARAMKLYEIYNQISKIEDIEPHLLNQIQDKYFGKSIDEIYNEIKVNLTDVQLKRAQSDSKYKFGLIIAWYYEYCSGCGVEEFENKNMNCMIPVSSAMGRINAFLKGSDYEKWENRHPDVLCKLIMSAAEKELFNILKKYSV